MNEFLAETAYFGLFLSIATYWIGWKISKKVRSPLANPLLISVALCIAFLSVFRIDFETFNLGKNGTGARMLQSLLTPATVCLAIPLYEKIGALKKHPAAILLGVFAGVLACCGTIWLMSRLFGLSRGVYATLLPKSITTAIGMDLSDQLGGSANVTVACIIFTGLFGNLVASSFLKLCRITDPIAVGLAIGTSSHALGTSRAHELGRTQEAMSSLSIAVAGLMTVAAASVFANLY